MSTGEHPPLPGLVHALLKIEGPGSSGELKLHNLSPVELDSLQRVAFLWNATNPAHAQPYISVEKLL